VFLCCYRFLVNKDSYKTFNSINHYASNSSTPAVAAIVRWAATAQWIALATEQRQYLPRIIMITVVGATDSHSNETSRRHLTNGRDTRQAGAPGIGWGRCDACHSIVYSSVQLASLDLLLRLFTASSDSRWRFVCTRLRRVRVARRKSRARHCNRWAVEQKFNTRWSGENAEFTTGSSVGYTAIAKRELSVTLFIPGVVKDCQSCFAIDLLSCVLKKRRDKFISRYICTVNGFLPILQQVVIMLYLIKCL